MLNGKDYRTRIECEFYLQINTHQLHSCIFKYISYLFSLLLERNVRFEDMKIGYNCKRLPVMWSGLKGVPTEQVLTRKRADSGG